MEERRRRRVRGGQSAAQGLPLPANIHRSLLCLSNVVKAQDYETVTGEMANVEGGQVAKTLYTKGGVNCRGKGLREG
jgi:hypothetical protein